MGFRDAWPAADVEREFEESGLACCTVRNPLGYRCGYVGLPGGHPLHGADRARVYAAAPDLDVEGGVSWWGPAGDLWAVGWDAGHLWRALDPRLLPVRARRLYEGAAAAGGAPAGEPPFDAGRAEAETRRLARQLASARPPRR